MIQIYCILLLCCTAMSYLVLGDLAVNTLRSMVSAQWQDKAAWGTSSAIAATAEGAKQVSTVLARAGAWCSIGSTPVRSCPA